MKTPRLMNGREGLKDSLETVGTNNASESTCASEPVDTSKVFTDVVMAYSNRL